MSQVQVVIVGAGPYGLAIASHLRAQKVQFRIFGHPMRFWREMPPGIFLKSFGFATTIDNPDGLTYPAWCRERGYEELEPCSVESFAEYGLWLQKRLVPEVEAKDVVLIERNETGGGFTVTLDSGERVEAERVVVAVGLRYFYRLPPPLARLPRELVTHTSQRSGYADLKGKDVVVLGAGQSALEAAALLHEAGARPQLLARGAAPFFYGKTEKERPLLDRLRMPITVFGAGRVNWVLQHFPFLMRWMPEGPRVRFTRRHLGPSGAWWLRDRFEGKVPVRAHCEVIGAAAEGKGLLLRVREEGREQQIRADHLVAGTGYEVDIGRLPFLAPDLSNGIARIEKAPRVDRHFQSSVPGLYFVGVSTMFNFGPLVRFVTGTSYCAPLVARHLARSPRTVRTPDVALQVS